MKWDADKCRAAMKDENDADITLRRYAPAAPI